MNAQDALERVELLLADPDELRRHLQTASLEREPKAFPLPDLATADQFLSEPSLLLWTYARVGLQSSPLWSRQLGRMGHRHRCRLNLMPPTWEDVSAKQSKSVASPLRMRVIRSVEPESIDSAKEQHLATALDVGNWGLDSTFRWEWSRWGESAGDPDRWTLLVGNDGNWNLICPSSRANFPLVISLEHTRSGMRESASFQAVGMPTAALPELGPAKRWLEGPDEDEIRIRLRSSADNWSDEERIPLRFGTAYVHLWNREEGFGFWPCFQALYRRCAQPTRVFDWITTELSRIRPTVKVGLPPLTGVRPLSEKICGDLLDARSFASRWRKVHPTPLELIVTGRTSAGVGREWNPVLDALRGAFAASEPTDRDVLERVVDNPDERDEVSLWAWHRLLVRFVAAGMRLARAVDLLMPLVPFDEKR